MVSKEAPPAESNGQVDEHATNGTVEAEKPEEEAAQDGQPPESVFQLKIKLPHEPFEASVMCSTHE